MHHLMRAAVLGTSHICAPGEALRVGVLIPSLKVRKPRLAHAGCLIPEAPLGRPHFTGGSEGRTDLSKVRANWGNLGLKCFSFPWGSLPCPDPSLLPHSPGSPVPEIQMVALWLSRQQGWAAASPAPAPRAGRNPSLVFLLG